MRTENVKETKAKNKDVVGSIAAGGLANGTVTRKKKVTTPIKKLSTGESFIGRLISQREKTWEMMNEKSGEFEEQTSVLLKFESPGGDSFEVFQDAGLRQALEQAEIKAGSEVYYEIVRMEQVELKGKN